MELTLALITIVPALANIAYTIWRDKHQNKSSLSRAIGYLLLRALKRNAQECITRGYISQIELEELEENYKLYHELGGNGFADAVMNNVRKLPLVQRREG